VDPYARFGADILRLGGLSERDRVDAEHLARGLGMTMGSEEAAYAGLAEGGLVVRRSVPTLWTRPGLTTVRRHEIQMRVIAEWFLRRDGMRVSTARSTARGVAAWLMAPSPSMVSVWHRTEGWPLLDRIVRTSLIFRAPAACIALRVAEITDRPAAVVTPSRVIRRGAPELDETECRDIADDGPPDSGYLCAASPDRHTHTIVVKTG
jgi:hypothetical protein